MLFAVSWLLVAVTLPFSLCVLLKVQYNTVQYSAVTLPFSLCVLLKVQYSTLQYSIIQYST